MNYALLWIDMLLVALLWTAFAAACLARLRKRWVRNALGCVLAPLPLVPIGFVAAAMGTGKFEVGFEPNWFYYALSLFLTCAAGDALIAWRASRREAGFALPAAGGWPRGLTGCAFLAAVAIGYITLANMDSTLRARCTIMSIDLSSTYRALAPAIVSESQNAAPLYIEAIARLKGDPDLADVQNEPFGKYDQPFDPNEPATLRMLARQAGTIQLLRRAATMPCRFDMDVESLDLDSMMKSLSGERLAANFLRLDESEALARGHVATAAEDSAAILRMSRQFIPRPMIISALAGIGINAVGVKTLEEMLPALKDRGDLAALAGDPLSSLRPLMQQSLRGEEAWGLAIIGNFSPDANAADAQSSRSPIAETSGPSGLLWRAFFLDLDDYIQLMQATRQWAMQPYYKISGQLKELSARRAGWIASILVPADASALEDLNRAEANDSCAAVAIAITRYRVDHGRMPANLSSLVPGYLDALPIDPFDGKLIRLAKKPDRWIIYSVGPDGVDDGGVPYNRHDKTGDLIFTLRLSPPHS